MPISKEDDKSSWEQFHIILLSHIFLYWIWSLLDSDESLFGTGLSPSIFGLQHCCRFHKRMQLNVGGLWLNTLFLYYPFYHLFLYFLFFSSISLPSAVYICSCSILSFSIFSFSLCWSLLACLGVINFNFVWCPSCLKKREHSSRLRVSKWSHGHLERRWQEFVGAISHNTSFTHFLHWIWSLLDSDESLLVTGLSPPIFGLQHCCRFRKRMQLNMGGLRLNTLFLYYLFHHLFLYFLFFSSISHPSAVYICSCSILSFSIFSFSLCWSLLACLGVINYNFISCPSCLK